MSWNQPDERTIGTLIERWAEAVRGQDMDGVLTDHAEDIVMFDVPPPRAPKHKFSYRSGALLRSSGTRHIHQVGDARLPSEAVFVPTSLSTRGGQSQSLLMSAWVAVKERRPPYPPPHPSRTVGTGTKITG